MCDDYSRNCNIYFICQNTVYTEINISLLEFKMLLIYCVQIRSVIIST